MSLHHSIQSGVDGGWGVGGLIWQRQKSTVTNFKIYIYICLQNTGYGCLNNFFQFVGFEANFNWFNTFVLLPVNVKTIFLNDIKPQTTLHCTSHSNLLSAVKQNFKSRTAFILNNNFTSTACTKLHLGVFILFCCWTMQLKCAGEICETTLE